MQCYSPPKYIILFSLSRITHGTVRKATPIVHAALRCSWFAISPGSVALQTISGQARRSCASCCCSSVNGGGALPLLVFGTFADFEGGNTASEDGDAGSAGKDPDIDIGEPASGSAVGVGAGGMSSETGADLRVFFLFLVFLGAGGGVDDGDGGGLVSGSTTSSSAGTSDSPAFFLSFCFCFRFWFLVSGCGGNDGSSVSDIVNSGDAERCRQRRDESKDALTPCEINIGTTTDLTSDGHQRMSCVRYDQEAEFKGSRIEMSCATTALNS